MKSTITFWLILSFTAIAVFGFFAMSANMADHKGCLASTAAGGICPSENIFNVAFFHTGVFKSFSLALVFFVLLLGIALALNTKISPQLLNFSLAFKKPQTRMSLEHHLTHWLALREKSPTD